MRKTFGFLLLFAPLAAMAQQTSYPVFETDKLPATFFAGRRAKVKEAIGQDGLAFFFTNPERNRNNDVDFRFRADTNFLYLSGFEEPDSALILCPNGVNVDGKKVTEILFVNVGDKMSETWLGYRMGPVDGKTLTGIECVLPNSRFSEILPLLGTSHKLYSASLPQGPTGTLARMVVDYTNWAKSSATSESGLRRIVNRMRGVKTDEEIAMIKKAAEASTRGHVAAIRMCKPGLREYNLQAIMEYAFTDSGCEYTGYPCIIGSGANSTILHYEANRKQIANGDMICMDCAGEFHGYSADVTRSFPANGKFTAAQKAIYEIVYAAQEAGIAKCVNGAGFGDAHAAAANVIFEGLKDLGIVKTRQEVGQYFMHGVSHGLGLDVHDPSPNTLVPGVVMTVEPGIYIKAGSPCDPKYWNIGVRIEDDILVTSSAPVNLSAGAPRKWQEIEALMKKK